MASIGEITVKVKPDLSAVMQADLESITDVLVVALARYSCIDRGDLRVVARALERHFYMLPRTDAEGDAQ